MTRLEDARLVHEKSDVLRRATLRPQNLGTCIEKYMDIQEIERHTLGTG